jgi:uncharacterized protein
MMIGPRGRAGVFLLVMALSTSLSAAGMTPQEQHLPTPLGYVSDYAHVLDEEWHQQIRSVCKDLETSAGIEMLVVTTPTISPLANAQDYAARLYEAWRIGTAQQERGILLLMAVKERQAAVVVGKSVLPVLTPLKMDEISRKFLRPMFFSREYALNLYRSAVFLATVAGQIPKEQIAQKPRRSWGFWMNLGVGLVMMYTIWRFTRPERRHPFSRWKKGEYWGTGQGGFGGNFGGFGGGTGGQGLG